MSLKKLSPVNTSFDVGIFSTRKSEVKNHWSATGLLGICHVCQFYPTGDLGAEQLELSTGRGLARLSFLACELL